MASYQIGEKLSNGSRVSLAIGNEVTRTAQLPRGQYLLSCDAACYVGQGASLVESSATSADVHMGAGGSIVLSVTDASSAFICVMHPTETGRLFIKPLSPANF